MKPARKSDLIEILAIGLLSLLASAGRLNAAQPAAAVERPRLFRLAFSGDGAHVIAAGDAIRIFDSGTGEAVERLPLARGSNTLAGFPGRDHLFAEGGESGVIRIRRVSERQPVRELKGHDGHVRNLAVSPDGKLLASVAGVLVEGRWKRTELRLWDAGAGRLLHELDLDDRGFGCSAFSRDGKQLAVAYTSQIPDEPSRIEIYDIRGWKRVRSIAFSPGFARSILFGGDRAEMLIVGGDCVPVNNGCQPTGRIWIAAPDAETAQSVEQDREYSYFLAAQTPTADRFVIGTSVVTATVNAKGKVDGARLGPLVQLRDAKTADVVWSKITKGAGDPDGIAVSHDGKLIAALVDLTIYLFDVEAGELVREIDVKE
ncbi:MAG: hypothetical protein HY290_22000 [Planctomycetia bacterium]|nr:hypothetical protein [Planctomycetia bacterium]